MISSWLAVAFVVCSAVIFLVRLPFNFPRTWQQLFTLFYSSILMDAATAEHLCGKPAPEPDVSQKSSGLYVRCESPFIYERGVYRVIWKN